MPVFNDSEPQGELLPEGDYTLVVDRIEQSISRGAKTAGSDVYEFHFRARGGGKAGMVRDNLIDSANTVWRLDLFLKACGVQLAKGDPFEFFEDVASAKGVRWVDPKKLTCTAHVVIETYRKNDGTEGRSNKIAGYLITKGTPATVPVVPKPGVKPKVNEPDEIPF